MIHDFATRQKLADQPACSASRQQLAVPHVRVGLRHLSLAVILLVIALGLSFALVHWFPEPLESTSQLPEPVAEPKKIDPGKQEPESYEFYDSLAQSSWQVPIQRGVYITEEDLRKREYRYRLQAASVRTRGDAEHLVKTLKSRDLQASYSLVYSDYGEAWYRVNVGPFDNVSIMNKAEDILVSMGMMPLKRRIK